MRENEEKMIGSAFNGSKEKRVDLLRRIKK